ncbi:MULTISPECIES: hypothetical protein [Rhizobium]|nr:MULTISPECIES: hypothetical protein [Rhizobium]MBM7048480.1 hypothetical protein [Rhizobium lusitanum]
MANAISLEETYDDKPMPKPSTTSSGMSASGAMTSASTAAVRNRLS